jgi:hypothetical protein
MPACVREVECLTMLIFLLDIRSRMVLIPAQYTIGLYAAISALSRAAEGYRLQT